MTPSNPEWQIQSPVAVPDEFVEAVRKLHPGIKGSYAAQLLWQRGVRDAQQLAGYLQPDSYQPASPFAFGEEMERAVARLQKAVEDREKIAIWGDFDADGITATSVLWEGLGEFFPQNQQLSYYIPNRLRESHGLNLPGIERLKTQGISLIVTCDTGSTNLAEINYANELGIEIVVTDHHTLPSERPNVAAIVNPRYLPQNHPLHHLSGVAVAYKLVEAMYLSLPHIPQQPLENLLDLVCIGLITDLVQLRGDCRYLAQQGLKRLQKQLQTPSRPGVAELLQLCSRNGDRPTDISFGIGPRINAISRIHGDATFGVELLTSRDSKRCRELAMITETANARRKGLQQDLIKQVKSKLKQVDLSTTYALVLWDEQWSTGVLGLVASQIAQEYGRPTILLSTGMELEGEEDPVSVNTLARGSARSVGNIDLYELVRSQSHLLHRFGGHPFAAGLSLEIDNLPLFTEGINRQLRELSLRNNIKFAPTIYADLICEISELGRDLYDELKLLEPYGMGNPAPQILIKNCRFTNVVNRNIKDLKQQKVQYIKTQMQIWDESSLTGFPAIWWGHYQEEVPEGISDAIAILDYNNYSKQVELRIVAISGSTAETTLSDRDNSETWILDWRDRIGDRDDSTLVLQDYPKNWDDLQVSCHKAIQAQKKLAIAYPPPQTTSPQLVWQQLIGIAKYLSRTGEIATTQALQDKLHLTSSTLHLGLQSLVDLGFQVEFLTPESLIIKLDSHLATLLPNSAFKFITALQEEHFSQTYFHIVPVSTLEAMVQKSEVSASTGSAASQKSEVWRES
ncbi:single-stranded-DNA-specific exonuclease RecJ [Merismopedia glauca]|uniref:Single-stranded-DNA-specific exonuclease RecJ n=1 Tax=Merismopedia glauca CCAP 1448/3 TaxID=1296344 RepID=A0A2T1C1T5_9CYAN|nr:single-stranded-DNA-specific exonuclease RecJ [Merismopedia glauca]PSB02117.1 single-stranded-DNA-specific exonuclease RecJ [Merismopedia glauca CCAP 1448/3]